MPLTDISLIEAKQVLRNSLLHGMGGGGLSQTADCSPGPNTTPGNTAETTELFRQFQKEWPQALMLFYLDLLEEYLEAVSNLEPNGGGGNNALNSDNSNNSWRMAITLFHKAEEHLDFHVQDAEGNTILHHLVRKFHNPDMLRKTVERMSVLDIQNHHGQTPLVVAGIEGNKAAFDMLMGRGANPDIPDHSGIRLIHLMKYGTRPYQGSIYEALLARSGVSKNGTDKHDGMGEKEKKKKKGKKEKKIAGQAGQKAKKIKKNKKLKPKKMPTTLLKRFKKTKLSGIKAKTRTKGKKRKSRP